jgi:hypothetical protein
MTLNELLPSLPLTYEQGKQYALVFSEELKNRLEEIQTENPSQHIAKPVATTDGRYLLCGDILSEVGYKGIFQNGFSLLDSERFNEIEVMSWQEGIDLLPVPETEI